MSKEFIWTTEYVKEYINYFNRVDLPLSKSLDDFIASKQPKPSFTTADGVDIFKEDEYYLVVNCSVLEAQCVCNPGSYPDEEKHLRFSTRQAAEQYVIENKPCLSLKDVCEKLGLLNYEKESLTNLIKSRL